MILAGIFLPYYVLFLHIFTQTQNHLFYTSPS